MVYSNVRHLLKTKETFNDYKEIFRIHNYGFQNIKRIIAKY